MSKKNYSMKDALMLQQSHVKRQHFIDNQGDFELLDPDFADPFKVNWNTSILASEVLPTDESRDDEISIETADVLETIAKAKQRIRELKYFAMKAFPNSTEELRTLGFDDYDEASNSQSELATLLGRMYNYSENTFKTELLAVNYTQPKIDGLLAVKDELQLENKEQDTMIQNTPIATQERNTQLNETFAFWKKVNLASKVIYSNDYAKLNLFLFPKDTEDPTIVKVAGTVRNQSNTLIAGVSVTIESLALTVVTDSNGQYVIGGIPGGTYTIKFNKAGFQEVTQEIIVPADGSIVVDAVLQAI
jgi:hypothetical protein